MGEFAIRGIEHGVYDLRVELGSTSLIVPGLPITQS
jgi:hypothetical protein